MREVTQTATELAKATIRFSWSLPLFGVQQVINMLSPSVVAAAFNHVSGSMEQELSGILRQAFTTGERVQGSVVDATVGGLVRNVASPSTASNIEGWGPMPYPVVVPASRRGGAAGALGISPDYPFRANYLDVCGSRMHYLDEGAGTPILLLHGNPTWSYIWRNIIPYLTPFGRCIAPDLIGYGRSGKPAIDYRWADHVRFLEEFIEKLNLRDIILVLHDQGSGLGFHYAMRHEDNVRGLAFFEAIIRPYSWDNFSTPEYREIFRRFRRGGVGGEGWQMLVEQNMFIEQLLPQAASRPLSEREMTYYREPFRELNSRLPIWRFANDTPIGGQPPDVWEAVDRYSKRLQRSGLPKLLLYATPGALVTSEHLDWARRSISNLRVAHVGSGAHFLQESSPHQIGTEVARWLATL